MIRLDGIKSPLLNDSVLKKLFSRKIFTVKHFLAEEADKIQSISGLQITDVIILRRSLVTTYSAFLRKATDESSDLSENSSILKTGIKCFENLMGEELKTGNIIEICGVSGSGKTQLCLTLGVNNSLLEQGVVHYIDTSLGNFTADRIENMLENRSISKAVIKETMNRIRITKINNMIELVSTLHALKTSLGNGEVCCRMVIIDSLAAVYLPLLNEPDNDGLSFVHYVASLMRFISKQYHLLFLVVNLATKFFDPEATFESSDELTAEPNRPFKDLKPLLGRYWLHAPSTRLLIHPVVEKSLEQTEKQPQQQQRIITVLKSSSIPIHSSCSVSVTGEGIVSNQQD